MLQTRLAPEFSKILIDHVGVRRLSADTVLTPATVYAWVHLGIPMQWVYVMYLKYPEVKFWEMFPKFDNEYFKNFRF